MACASVTTSEMMLNCGSISRRCGATVRAPRHLATLDGSQNYNIISTVNSHLSKISIFWFKLWAVASRETDTQCLSQCTDAFDKPEYMRVSAVVILILCGLVGVCQCIRGTCHICLHGRYIPVIHRNENSSFNARS
jgi:hypothetical protein